jgi:hypothetical protein
MYFRGVVYRNIDSGSNSEASARGCPRPSPDKIDQFRRSFIEFLNAIRIHVTLLNGYQSGERETAAYLACRNEFFRCRHNWFTIVEPPEKTTLMSTRISFAVMSPDGECSQYDSDPYDIPRSIAIALSDRLPTDRNVVLLHQGRILSPYLSFEHQNVRSGDIIIIHSLPPKGSDPARRRQLPGGAVRQISRLVDIVRPPAELPQSSDSSPTPGGTAGRIGH